MKSFLLHEGTDPKYGARHLKRAIERHLVFPLANLVATGQVRLGDFIRIDMADRRCSDFRERSRRRDGTDADGTLRRSGRNASYGGTYCAHYWTPRIRGHAERRDKVSFVTSGQEKSAANPRRFFLGAFCLRTSPPRLRRTNGSPSSFVIKWVDKVFDCC